VCHLGISQLMVLGWCVGSAGGLVIIVVIVQRPQWWWNVMVGAVVPFLVLVKYKNLKYDKIM
jgi:prolyl oligopeptidase PreP (S9A serine peptidase family)